MWITSISPSQTMFLFLFETFRACTGPQQVLSLSLSFPCQPVVFTKLPVVFQSCFRRTLVRVVFTGHRKDEDSQSIGSVSRETLSLHALHQAFSMRAIDSLHRIRPCFHTERRVYISRMSCFSASSSSRSSRLSFIFSSTFVTEYMTVEWSRLNFLPMSLNGRSSI